ncbi:MAG: DUF3857 domain-containing protein [Acidobacteriia bacterium]|nr:DUF3857 domain-containing protein [Terriglobia bacterium]
MNARFRYFPILLLVMILWAACGAMRVQGDDWQPVDPAELKMTSEPLAPGAPAIILYRKVERDDVGARELNYARIKILSEEGRKYGDVEIPFFKGAGGIHGIKARTIRPDGQIINFDGKVYEKTVVKAKGVKYLAKTFSLPEVQVGSIIEYRYMADWEQGWVYDSRWILSEDLFTKKAVFSLKPHPEFALRWSWGAGLPPGTPAPKDEGGYVRLESNNIPAFQVEDYMPPQDELKFRVNFIYSRYAPEKDLDKFWKNVGKEENSKVEEFIGKRKAMEQAVAEIVSPQDSAETKLRKIYARVQKVRNLSFEKEKSEQEQKREKRKEINNVEDVWKNGYAHGGSITWLFLGLARAAGFEAYPVMVSRRDQYFFNPGIMNPTSLNDTVVQVKVDGKEQYFDPGTAFTPYGLLPWPETMASGRKLGKDGGAWVRTTQVDSSVSRVERKADLKLDADTGALEGKLTVRYTGLEALNRRLEERNEDEANRKEFLEGEVREHIPAAIEVELAGHPDWESSEAPLVAEFSLKIPGWVAGAGRRALLTAGIFGAAEKHVFEHASRNHPIYFDFPFESEDEVSIDLPLGWKVGSMPPAQGQENSVVGYALKAEESKGSVHIARKMKINLLLLDQKQYGALQNFFRMIRSGDEQQIVLQPVS